jgi:hypothetical protein
MTQDQLNVLLASGKHLVSYVAGAATVFGIMSQTSSADLMTDFDHIFNGIKEIAIGVGPIATLAMGWWSAHNATTQAKVAAVQAAEPHALVQAVQAVAPVTLRDAVAAQPEVKAVVVTSQAVADASPSEKVKT